MSSNVWPMPTMRSPPGLGAVTAAPATSVPRSAGTLPAAAIPSAPRLSSSPRLKLLSCSAMKVLPDLPTGYDSSCRDDSRGSVCACQAVGLTNLTHLAGRPPLSPDETGNGVRRSVHEPAAADVQRRAGDVAGVVGC